MRLTWASKAGMSDLTALAQDIRKLAGAVLQVYKAIRDYRAGYYPHLPYVEARRVYPIILTLEDWYCCGLYLPTLLDEAVRNLMQAANLPLEWLQAMPYAVISIDEFETAAGVTSAAGIYAFWSGKLEERRRGAGRSAVIATTALPNRSALCRISSLMSTKRCSLASTLEIVAYLILSEIERIKGPA